MNERDERPATERDATTKVVAGSGRIWPKTRIRRRTAAALLATGALGVAGAGVVVATTTPRGPGIDGPASSAHVLGRLASLPPDQGVLLALDLRGDVSAVAAGFRNLYAAVHNSGTVEFGLGLGASFFDAVGLVSCRPRHLTTMPSFSGDLLESDATHGDILLYIAAHTAAQVQMAERVLLAVVPTWVPRWRVLMRRDDNRMVFGRPTNRNRFDYTEGLGNPNTAADIADRAVVTSADGEPAWAHGGSYQVVRRIHLATELWSDHPQGDRDRIIGRRTNGAWLDGTPANSRPDFTTDPLGLITPLDAHVRRANPAGPHAKPVALIRRSYTLADSPSDGLVFICYQRSLANGFIAVQHRLAGEAMAPYLLTVGGGYWFVPRSDSTWLHQLFI